MDPLPETIYSAQSSIRNPRLLITQFAQGLLNSRELIWALFIRDLRAQFRQSYFGYAWLFFPPLINSMIWLILNNSGVVKISETGIPYPAYVLIGTFLWQTLSESLTKPLQALTQSKTTLIKIKFPVEAPLLAGILMSLVNAGIRLLLLFPLLLLIGIPLSFKLLFIPLGFVSMMLLGLALGLVVTPIGLLYTDVGRALGIGTSLAMYLTPVVYPIAQSGILHWIHRLNPATYPLESVREMIGEGTTELWLPAMIITVLALGLSALGAVLMRIVMPHLVVRMGM